MLLFWNVLGARIRVVIMTSVMFIVKKLGNLFKRLEGFFALLGVTFSIIILRMLFMLRSFKQKGAVIVLFSQAQ